MFETYKEVFFWQYCKTCKHEKTKESEDPCHNCLNSPSNVHSHKPINWEEKE